MYRSMFQVYVKNSIEAVETYKKAFNVTKFEVYPNENGNGYMHSELDVYGQVLAVSEAYDDADRATGNTMQFCLHFGEGGEEYVRNAIDVLKDGALHIDHFDADWTTLGYDITDKYGVRWCIFV